MRLNAVQPSAKISPLNVSNPTYTATDSSRFDSAQNCPGIVYAIVAPATMHDNKMNGNTPDQPRSSVSFWIAPMKDGRNLGLSAPDIVFGFLLMELN